MFELDAYLGGLLTILGAAVLTWLISVAKRDVSIVDSLWGMLFLIAVFTYAALVSQRGPRALLVIATVALWAIRLSAYITWRNHGQPEDRRYRDMRRRNEPNYTFKSLYLVFGLQGLLAWIISLPLFAAIASAAPLGTLDYVGASLALAGLVFEATADWQLARFKASPANENRVMDRGLWRYSRHPNYFGEFCVWWGLYAIALAGGAWWSIVSPLLMSFLLLRVSGVVLLEKDIGQRRPDYAHYRARTNAFLPGPPRDAAHG
jgi:steroid 5-alpha reductase family enzyme